MAKTMTVEQVQEIQDKIARASQLSAKAEGSIERIQKDWKDKYGFDTMDEAEAYLESLRKKHTNMTSKEEELMSELDGLVDWDTL